MLTPIAVESSKECDKRPLVSGKDSCQHFEAIFVNLKFDKVTSQGNKQIKIFI